MIPGSTGLIDPQGRPLSSESVPMGILNENYFTWTQYQPEIYYNPDNLTLDVYEKMYNTDETVYSGIEFIVMAALSRLGEYTHEDSKIDDFVSQQLVEMNGSFTSKVKDIMTGTFFGFSVTEIIWKKLGSMVGLSDLQTLHPQTIHFDLHREGPLKNQLKRIVQWYQQDHEVEIPVKKAVVYTHGQTFGNKYGVSRLKRAYKSWYLKDIILKAWGLTCQRYGTPYTYGKTSGNGNVNVGGQSKPAIDHMMDVLNSFGQKGSAVIGLEDEIKMMYAGTGYGKDFESFVAYCNKMIYRALGLPSLIADNGSTGSYSLGKQHYVLFVQMMTDMLLEVIDVLVEQLIRPMIELNFGVQESYGTFGIENFETEDAKTLAETAKILAETGLSNLHDIDQVNYWLERMGLPVRTEEEMEIGQSAPPEIPGLESAAPAPSTEPETDAEIVAELEDIREHAHRKGKVYNFSQRARIAAQREMRRRTSSRRDVDRLAEQLARFSRPA